jgi:hypothetical protein
VGEWIVASIRLHFQIDSDGALHKRGMASNWGLGHVATHVAEGITESTHSIA